MGATEQGLVVPPTTKIKQERSSVKKLLIIISVFAIAACSSKPKEEEQEMPAEQPVVSESAPAPTTEESKDSVAMDSGSADSGANMEGGFPDVEGTERSGATCKNGAQERMVSVIDTREGPCGVVYTKGGNKNTVAYAKNDMGFCDKVFDNIVGNLTGGGFDCGGAGNTAKAEAAPTEEPAAEESGEGGEEQ